MNQICCLVINPSKVYSRMTTCTSNWTTSALNITNCVNIWRKHYRLFVKNDIPPEVPLPVLASKYQACDTSLLIVPYCPILTIVTLLLFKLPYLLQFRLRLWGGVASWLWRYKSGITGRKSWLSKDLSRCHSGECNLYPTRSTFTGLLYGLLSVALYIDPIYYKTLFILFYTMPLIITFSSPQYNNTGQVNLSVFCSLVHLTLI